MTAHPQRGAPGRIRGRLCLAALRGGRPGSATTEWLKSEDWRTDAGC
jgi:hypothetical protein